MFTCVTDHKRCHSLTLITAVTFEAKYGGFITDRDPGSTCSSRNFNAFILDENILCLLDIPCFYIDNQLVLKQ